MEQEGRNIPIDPISIAIGLDGTIAVACNDNHLRLYRKDKKTGLYKLVGLDIKKAQAHKGPINAVAFRRIKYSFYSKYKTDDYLYAGGEDDRPLKSWKLVDIYGWAFNRFDNKYPKISSITSIAASNDGEYVACGDSDGNLKIFEMLDVGTLERIETLKLLQTLPGPKGDTNSTQNDKPEQPGDNSEKNGDNSEQKGGTNSTQNDKPEQTGDNPEKNGDTNIAQNDKPEKNGDNTEQKGDTNSPPGNIISLVFINGNPTQLLALFSSGKCQIYVLDFTGSKGSDIILSSTNDNNTIKSAPSKTFKQRAANLKKLLIFRSPPPVVKKAEPEPPKFKLKQTLDIDGAKSIAVSPKRTTIIIANKTGIYFYKKEGDNWSKHFTIPIPNAMCLTFCPDEKTILFRNEEGFLASVYFADITGNTGTANATPNLKQIDTITANDKPIKKQIGTFDKNIISITLSPYRLNPDSKKPYVSFIVLGYEGKIRIGIPKTNDATDVTDYTEYTEVEYENSDAAIYFSKYDPLVLYENAYIRGDIIEYRDDDDDDDQGGGGKKSKRKHRKTKRKQHTKKRKHRRTKIKK